MKICGKAKTVHDAQTRDGEHGGCKSYLVVEVIKVARDKNVNVPHDLQNVQTLMRAHREYSPSIYPLHVFN